MIGQKSFIFDARMPCWIKKCGYFLKKGKLKNSQKRKENRKLKKRKKEKKLEKKCLKKKKMKQKIEKFENNTCKM